jgi:glycosyltransferase involved in cell wall biosynthesis
MVDLTVLIATYNRADLLKQTLESLCRLESPGCEWKLVVCDNNSTDLTGQIVQSFSRRLPLAYVSEPRQGKNRALNTGLRVAEGELYAFTDDDVIVDSGWLLELWRGFTRWPAAAVLGGRIGLHWPEQTPGWLRSIRREFQQTYYVLQDFGSDPGSYRQNEGPAGANMAVRSELFKQGLRFNEQIGPLGSGRIAGSEAELLSRLRDAGHQRIYVPSAVVHHVLRPEMVRRRWLRRRGYGHGRGLAWWALRGDYPSIAGVPRFAFRSAADELLRCVIASARRKPADALEAEVRVCMWLGYILELLKLRLGRTGRAAGSMPLR